jgi:WD40 repeat protein
VYPSLQTSRLEHDRTTSRYALALTRWHVVNAGGSGWLGKKASIQPLHRQHTAQVLTLCVPDCERVFSGGADKRVVLHSLGAPGGAGATFGTVTLEGRVNRILCRDKAILVSTCTPTDQLYLFDARTIGQSSGKSHATACLGWKERKEGSQTSALTAPSWSACGNLIACGTASGIVNVWDIRMTRDAGIGGGVMPIESFDAHANRVMVRCFCSQNLLPLLPCCRCRLTAADP